jgi:hypothetical protein
MNKLLFVCSLIVMLTPFAKAEKQQVVEQIDSSMTINVINLPVGVATQVDPSSILMLRRTFIAIQNLSISSDTFCSERSNVTTATGFMVPKGGAIVTIPAASGINNLQKNRITFYCITADLANPGKVAIIQGY